MAGLWAGNLALVATGRRGRSPTKQLMQSGALWTLKVRSAEASWARSSLGFQPNPAPRLLPEGACRIPQPRGSLSDSRAPAVGPRVLGSATVCALRLLVLHPGV